MADRLVRQCDPLFFLTRQSAMERERGYWHSYLILCPHSKSTLNIWRSTFGTFCWRPAAIVLEKVFLLLTKYLGNSATPQNQPLSYVWEEMNGFTFSRRRIGL